MSQSLHVTDLLPAFALGALDAPEAQQVRRHLSQCKKCLRDLEELQGVEGLLALVVPHVSPDPALKARLLNRVRAEAAQAGRGEEGSTLDRLKGLIQRNALVWTPISIVVIIGLLIGNLLLWQRAPRQAAGTPLWAVPLVRTDASPPGASGVLAMSEDGQAGALVVYGLEPLAPGQQYQLWLIRDGERDSGAVFSVDEEGEAIVRVDARRALLEYANFGITIEPAGGSPGPTGDKVMGGSL
jgi:anti-sigma-K factor RskA